MKKLIFLFAIVILSSCARFNASVERDFSGTRLYVIKMYSGGNVVFYDSLETILNNSERSDGCYYFKGDTLMELTGDYVIKSY